MCFKLQQSKLLSKTALASRPLLLRKADLEVAPIEVHAIHSHGLLQRCLVGEMYVRVAL
jgi:hypothetical protein